MSLITLIKTAIVERNVEELYRLKNICDQIHSTGEEYDGYTIEDLPSDTLYEEMVSVLKLIAETLSDQLTKTKRPTSTSTSTNHEEWISEMWMGSVPKLAEIDPIETAIMIPKYDGCSAGIKLMRNVDKFITTQAITRGTTVGANIRQTNIIEKIQTIDNTLTEGLSNLEYSFENGKEFADVHTISIRCEVIIKDKSICTTAPASVVAGKINGYMDVWNEFKDNLELIPFEIMRITFIDDTRYIPTQIESIDIFRQMDFDIPFSLVNLTEDGQNTVKSCYEKLCTTIPHPIDGVIYCSMNWTYPHLEEQTKPKQYGKYAWKPNSEVTTVMRGVDYTIARDGKFTFIIRYDPVKIGGKNYKQAKTATSRMIKLKGIGIGSIITVKISNDIIPMVEDFIENESIEPFEFPDMCPFCNTPTTLLSTAKTATLKCHNAHCPGQLKQKMLNFLKTVGIKGIAEAGLNKLQAIQFVLLIEAFPNINIWPVMMSVDIQTFLIAIGVGAKLAVNKLLEKHNINPQYTAYDYIKEVYDMIAPIIDPFIDDAMMYMLYKKNIPIKGFNC